MNARMTRKNVNSHVAVSVEVHVFDRKQKQNNEKQMHSLNHITELSLRNTWKL